MFYQDIIREVSGRKVAVSVNGYYVGDHEPKARLADAIEFIIEDEVKE